MPAKDSSNEISRSKRRSAPRAGPARRPPAEAEEVAEDVGEVREDVRVEARTLPAGALHAGVAEPVVARALFGVAEHGVGLGRFLEAFLGLLVAGIAIGVVLQRQLAIGALDVLLVRAPFDAEDFVVVAAAHALATLTMAGRSSR